MEINHLIKLTLITALVPFGLFSLYFDLWSGCEVLLGALWSCANIWLIKSLVVPLFTEKKRPYLKIFATLGLKFPLLYAVAYLLLTVGDFPPWNVLLGFSLLFIVLFFHSFSQLVSRKSTLCFLLLMATPSLHASIDADVPELPNFISLLHQFFHQSSLVSFLYEWETLIFSIIAASGISLLFHLGSRNSSLIPTPLQNFLEWFVENLRNFIIDILGPEGEKYVPFLGTLFIYILVMNWLVLIPLMKAPTSSFNITVALAICVFVLVQYLNIKNYGLRGFIFHMAGSPKDFMGWMLVPLMLPIEILTQFTRPITLSLRLFGNVLGEDILIGAFALFGVSLLSPYYPSIGFPLQIPFMFLALLTGLMQALVFTLLTTIYILLSVPGYEGNNEH